MEEKQPAVVPAQAGHMSVSAPRSRDADAGTGHRQEAPQEEQSGLLVHVEWHQSPSWLWGHRRQRPVLKEVIVSFKRRPSEEPDRSSWAQRLPQQRDGLEDSQPQGQGQDFSQRCPGALSDTPGQVSANDRRGETGQGRTTSLPWTMGHAAARRPQVTRRRFTEGSVNQQVLLERPGAQGGGSEAAAWAKEQECEDSIGAELSEEEEWEDALDAELSTEEEWKDAVSTELYQGTADIGSCPVHHWVNCLGMDDNKVSHTGPKEGPTDGGRGASGTLKPSQDKEHPSNEDHGEDTTAVVTPVAQEEPSVAGEQAAAGPDPGQAFTYSIPFSAFLDTLAEGRQTWRRKALSVLQKALLAAQGKGGQTRQHPTGSKEVLPEPAQSIRAEGLDKGHPVTQGPGQQLVEAEPELQVSMKEATEAGRSAGPAFRSPSPTVIDALARERRTSVFKSAPRALRRPSTATLRRGEQEEQQQPTACVRDLPDTAPYISSDVLSKATIVIQGLKQTEKQEHSRDATLTIRARAAGAAMPARGPHSPTADGLALPDTAPYRRDEQLGRAVIVIQGSKHPMKEQRGLEQGTVERMRVTAPEEGTESPGHTVHSGTADAPVILNYNDYTQREVVKKAKLMIQVPFKYSEEEQDDEQNAEGSTTAERLAGRTENLPASTVFSTPAQERWPRPFQRTVGALPLASTATSSRGERQKEHSTADATDLLDTAEYIRGDVLDKATLEIQSSSQQIVEEQDMEHSRHVSPTVTPTTAGTKSRVHDTQHPTADALLFLDYNDFLRTEPVKKAVLLVQKSFNYPEEP
ncbi:hypothetical protein HGM15179_016648 [Zosterops borbonicus]|uniref:Uncharacterized protein n=1 Tax=Zosterops borbonicus TaxID=364589 RepID=A0A8K1LE07_9PASS|nr:hypothetical protein HGM15179_016648 [Zosterops borbonicus]